jgi:hypothetical protein
MDDEFAFLSFNKQLGNDIALSGQSMLYPMSPDKAIRQ